MLTVLALVAIAAGMLISVGSVVSLWIDSRKHDNDDDRSATSGEY
jgi:hypothetical protein